MIRKAAVADASELGRLHVRSWQQAYTGLLPQSFLDSLDNDERARGWEGVLTEDGNQTDVLVDEATPDGIVGFACYGPSRDSDAAGSTGELLAMYYEAGYWGSGHADDLFEAVRSALSARGMDEMSLWVLFENRRAIAFYRKHGFVFDGHEKEQALPGTAVREVRMVRQAT